MTIDRRPEDVVLQCGAREPDDLAQISQKRSLTEFRSTRRLGNGDKGSEFDQHVALTIAIGVTHPHDREAESANSCKPDEGRGAGCEVLLGIERHPGFILPLSER